MSGSGGEHSPKRRGHAGDYDQKNETQTVTAQVLAEDASRAKPKREGSKYDDDKLPLQLLPVDALEEIAKVLHFGAVKYGARNWENGIAYGRVFGATLRHLFAWQRGEDNDAETGLSHISHAGCEVLFLLSFILRKQRTLDDRPVSEGVK